MERDYLANIPDVAKVRATIKLNGVTLDWLSFEVSSTNTHAADTFRVEVPLYDQTVEDLQILMDTETLELEIAVDDGNGTLVRIMYGLVDDTDIDMITGDVTFVGRDLTSLLMDKKALLYSVIAQLPASKIAEDMAVEHGLKADNITATTTPIGTYDGWQHVNLNVATSEWDLLCKLAQNENFDVYIKDDSLYFQPKTTTKDYYKIDWNYAGKNDFEASNALRLKVGRNHTIANDIRVVVRGHDILSGKSYSYTFSRQHTPQRGGKRAKKQTYYITANGISNTVAEAIGQNALEHLSKHEKKLSATLMGDTVLTPRSIIKLTGVNHLYDQLYYPYSITRSMSFGESFVMDVMAKNHDVNSQVV